jgi:hypothetical protein
VHLLADVTAVHAGPATLCGWLDQFEWAVVAVQDRTAESLLQSTPFPSLSFDSPSRHTPMIYGLVFIAAEVLQDLLTRANIIGSVGTCAVAAGEPASDIPVPGHRSIERPGQTD